MIDYFLKSPASNVALEVFDAKQNLVRRFSSQEKNLARHASLPVAERWFPKPEILEKTVGMHRFVWNLTWGSSGGPVADEEADLRNPSGPKVIPGTYQIRLVVDGQSQTQSLEVRMDPRSPATPEVLSEQFRMAKEMFDETVEARRALAEITAVQKQLTEAQQKAAAQSPEFKSDLTDAQSSINNILDSKGNSQDGSEGLQEAYKDVASALRVVEGGDRHAPSQAIAVYKGSSQQIKARIAEWAAFKQTKLPDVNRLLLEGNFAPVAIADIEKAAESLSAR
jgi:hypothetical protein